MLNKTGLRMGWSDMNANGMINQTYSTMSFGQYNYRENASYAQTPDSEMHLYDGHLRGETRTVTYDDLSLWNGADGYDLVNPDTAGNIAGGTSESSSNGGGDNVHLVKRNASGFAIKGGNGGSNGQSVQLSSDIDDRNSTWTEIDRGNGFYSYQKLDTDYCMNSGSGGANGQNIYLWLCSDSNQNQHWKKVNVGGGNYLLEKRNAPDYAIDGGRGGAEGQNVYLWSRSTTNQNQHWRFD